MTRDLDRDDVALLPLLHELLRTRNVTATAKKLGRTQPSVSHALARSRKVFGDALLVRVGGALVPTPFAEKLMPRLDAAVVAIGSVFAPEPGFSPGALDRTFVLAGTDFSEAMLVPPLVRRLATIAPRVDLVCVPAGGDVERALQEREVDLAFGTAFRERSGIVVKRLVEDDLVLVTRRDHPAPPTLDATAFARLAHVLVAPRGAPGGAIDVTLEKLGLVRRVAVRVRNFGSAMALVAETDLVTSVPRRYAETMRARLPIALHELPFAAPRFRFALAWLEASSRDPAHVFFREIVAEVVAGAFAPPKASRR